MNVLLHICCAPCAIYPVSDLRRDGHQVTGLFYNPNIQPYSEYSKRRDTLIDYCEDISLKLIRFEDYPMEEFLKGVAFREAFRCEYCYHMRLQYAVGIARHGKFDAFTTTLLYSKFQNHERIKEMGTDLGVKNHLDFLYRDFRAGWKEGIVTSKEMNMYRQQYCGCIYSEKERFFKRSNT